MSERVYVKMMRDNIEREREKYDKHASEMERHLSFLEKKSDLEYALYCAEKVIQEGVFGTIEHGCVAAQELLRATGALVPNED